MDNRTNQPILALDPGTRELGYAVLRSGRLQIAHVLSLRLLPQGKRLSRVREAFEGWIQAYRPAALVLEHMPRRPLDSIGGLPSLRRLLLRLARRASLPVFTYSARTVRRSVVGNGWAGKREAAVAITRRFPELRVHLTQDRKWKRDYWQNLHDAVALALHHQSVTQPPSRSR